MLTLRLSPPETPRLSSLPIFVSQTCLSPSSEITPSTCIVYNPIHQYNIQDDEISVQDCVCKCSLIVSFHICKQFKEVPINRYRIHEFFTIMKMQFIIVFTSYEKQHFIHRLYGLGAKHCHQRGEQLEKCSFQNCKRSYR
jgi:hypothetical protein